MISLQLSSLAPQLPPRIPSLEDLTRPAFRIAEVWCMILPSGAVVESSTALYPSFGQSIPALLSVEGGERD
jgi:hypothetical protein